MNRRNGPQKSSYLNIANDIPHGGEGERVLLECVPLDAKRILDLGPGDGRLVKLLKRDRPNMQAVALDISPTMLKMARGYFADDESVKLVEHDLIYPLQELGLFDAVVSSFAIHHLTHKRKRSLDSEVFDILNPSGIFCNLEHVASPNTASDFCPDLFKLLRLLLLLTDRCNVVYQ